MRFVKLRRRLHGRRACDVQTCPYPRAKDRWLTHWCRDHTLSIFASSDDQGETWRREAAAELGPRRWFLHAEVTAEMERRAVPVLAAILEMTPQERSYPANRYCWDKGAVKLSGRVEELLCVSEEGTPEPSP